MVARPTIGWAKSPFALLAGGLASITVKSFSSTTWLTLSLNVGIIVS